LQLRSQEFRQVSRIVLTVSIECAYPLSARMPHTSGYCRALPAAKGMAQQSNLRDRCAHREHRGCRCVSAAVVDEQNLERSVAKRSGYLLRERPDILDFVTYRDDD
jgi:hypothetical protein